MLFFPFLFEKSFLSISETFFHPIIEKGANVSEVTYTYKWERPDVAMVGKEIGKRCHEDAKRRMQEDADGNNKVYI